MAAQQRKTAKVSTATPNEISKSKSSIKHSMSSTITSTSSKIDARARLSLSTDNLIQRYKENPDKYRASLWTRAADLQKLAEDDSSDEEALHTEFERFKILKVLKESEEQSTPMKKPPAFSVEPDERIESSEESVKAGPTTSGAELEEEPEPEVEFVPQVPSTVAPSDTSASASLSVSMLGQETPAPTSTKKGPEKKVAKTIYEWESREPVEMPELPEPERPDFVEFEVVFTPKEYHEYLLRKRWVGAKIGPPDGIYRHFLKAKSGKMAYSDVYAAQHRETIKFLNSIAPFIDYQTLNRSLATVNFLNDARIREQAAENPFIL